MPEAIIFYHISSDIKIYQRGFARAIHTILRRKKGEYIMRRKFWISIFSVMLCGLGLFAQVHAESGRIGETGVESIFWGLNFIKQLVRAGGGAYSLYGLGVFLFGTFREDSEGRRKGIRVIIGGGIVIFVMTFLI